MLLLSSVLTGTTHADVVESCAADIGLGRGSTFIEDLLNENDSNLNCEATNTGSHIEDLGSGWALDYDVFAKTSGGGDAAGDPIEPPSAESGFSLSIEGSVPGTGFSVVSTADQEGGFTITCSQIMCVDPAEVNIWYLYSIDVSGLVATSLSAGTFLLYSWQYDGTSYSGLNGGVLTDEDAEAIRNQNPFTIGIGNGGEFQIGLSTRTQLGGAAGSIISGSTGQVRAFIDPVISLTPESELIWDLKFSPSVFMEPDSDVPESSILLKLIQSGLLEKSEQ